MSVLKMADSLCVNSQLLTLFQELALFYCGLIQWREHFKNSLLLGDTSTVIILHPQAQSAQFFPCCGAMKLIH